MIEFFLVLFSYSLILLFFVSLKSQSLVFHSCTLVVKSLPFFPRVLFLPVSPVHPFHPFSLPASSSSAHSLSSNFKFGMFRFCGLCSDIVYVRIITLSFSLVVVFFKSSVFDSLILFLSHVFNSFPFFHVCPLQFHFVFSAPVHPFSFFCIPFHTINHFPTPSLSLSLLLPLPFPFFLRLTSHVRTAERTHARHVVPFVSMMTWRQAPPLSPPLPVRPTSRTSPNAASRNVRSTPRSLAETPRHPARGAHGEAHEGDRNVQGFPVRWGPTLVSPDQHLAMEDPFVYSFVLVIC